MNLVLVEPAEVANGRIALEGRRAEHVAHQLRAAVGDHVRLGRIGHGTGQARVVAIHTDPTAVELRYDLGDEVPPPETPTDVLLLAVPRPVVLLRVLAAATTIGFRQIVLLRTWRVDKSHLQSDALTDAAIGEALRDGLEQSARTRPPVVHRHYLFKPFVEDTLPTLLADAPARFVAHPRASDGVETTASLRPAEPFALAIGPERGLTDYELDQFGTAGFEAVHGGPHPLRVETAVVALHARLDSLRRLLDAR